MGFYQPAQIVIDAKKHGVEVRPVDINYSDWDNTLEEKSGNYCALRLGFRQVKGIREDDILKLVLNRQNNFKNLNELFQIYLPDAAIEKLADADAFRSIDLDRRQALWEISIKDKPIAVFSEQPIENTNEKIILPQMSTAEHVVHDYAATSLSLKAHPVSFVRQKLQQLHVLSTSDLANAKDGDIVKVAGLVLVRQRPGTAKGVCFMTIEDETSVANLVFFENLFEKYRKEILQSRLIMAEGKLQIEGEVIHVIVKQCYDFSKLLRQLTVTTDNEMQQNIQEKLFNDARNFR